MPLSREWSGRQFTTLPLNHFTIRIVLFSFVQFRPIDCLVLVPLRFSLVCPIDRMVFVAVMIIVRFVAFIDYRNLWAEYASMTVCTMMC